LCKGVGKLGFRVNIRVKVKVRFRARVRVSCCCAPVGRSRKRALLSVTVSAPASVVVVVSSVRLHVCPLSYIQFVQSLSARLSAPVRLAKQAGTGRCARTDGRLGVYSGALPPWAAHGRRSGAPDSLLTDPPEDCRPQVPVMPLL